jgi:hypothetical protein
MITTIDITKPLDLKNFNLLVHYLAQTTEYQNAFRGKPILKLKVSGNEDSSNADEIVIDTQSQSADTLIAEESVNSKRQPNNQVNVTPVCSWRDLNQLSKAAKLLRYVEAALNGQPCSIQWGSAKQRYNKDHIPFARKAEVALVPVLFDKKHWVLIKVDVQNKEITYIDPRGGARGFDVAAPSLVEVLHNIEEHKVTDTRSSNEEKSNVLSEKGLLQVFKSTRNLAYKTLKDTLASEPTMDQWHDHCKAIKKDADDRMMLFKEVQQAFGGSEQFKGFTFKTHDEKELTTSPKLTGWFALENLVRLVRPQLNKDLVKAARNTVTQLQCYKGYKGNESHPKKFQGMKELFEGHQAIKLKDSSVSQSKSKSSDSGSSARRCTCFSFLFKQKKQENQGRTSFRSKNKKGQLTLINNEGPDVSTYGTSG